MPSNIFTRTLQKRLAALAFCFAVVFGALLTVDQHVALANHVVDAGSPFSEDWTASNQFNMAGWSISGLPPGSRFWTKDSGPGSVSWIDSAIDNNTPRFTLSRAGTYTFSYNYAALGSESDSTTVTAKLLDPSFNTPSASCTSATFSWGAISSGGPAVRYVVEPCINHPSANNCLTGLNPTGQTGISYTISESGPFPSNYWAPGRIVSVRVHSLCDDGSCPQGYNTSSVTIPSCVPSAPSTPTGLTVTPQCSGTNSRINIDWADTAGADSYELSRCTNAGCSPISYTNTSGSSYLNTSLTAGTLYRYRVRACNTGGCSSNTNVAEATALNCSVPPPPPAPSCNTAVFNSANSGFYPNSQPGAVKISYSDPWCNTMPYKFRCDYGSAVAGANTIAPPPGCQWGRWVGNAAEFDCPGYTVVTPDTTISKTCSIGSGGSMNVCSPTPANQSFNLYGEECPNCSANFSPSSISSGGSATFNATADWDANSFSTWSCTGGISQSGSFQSSMSQFFSNITSAAICTVSADAPSGVVKNCVANLGVGAACGGLGQACCSGSCNSPYTCNSGVCINPPPPPVAPPPPPAGPPPPVAPPPPVIANNSQCVAINTPATIEAGTAFWTTVVMNNNGTKTWAQSTNHKLGPNDSSVAPGTSVWSPFRVSLPSSSVAPGADTVFQFLVTAPSGSAGPGTYSSYGWKMLEENVEWFDQACTQAVNVTATPEPPLVADASCATSWGPNISIGGTPNIGRNPAIAKLPFGDERLIVAMWGIDGRVYVREWENDSIISSWYWVNNGMTAGRPKLVTISGELWLFISGLDGYLHKARYISEGTWSPWIHTSLLCNTTCASSGSGSPFNTFGPRAVDTSWGTWRASVVGGQDVLQKCIEIITPPPPPAGPPPPPPPPAGPPPPPAPEAIKFDLHGFGWSPNIGWLAMNCNDKGTCGGGAHKVQVDSDTGYLSGEAWSSNIGWVRFNPINTTDAPEAPFAPARLANNKITGWARACSGTYYKDCISATRTDGWDGWIKLSPEVGESQDAYVGYGLTKIAQHIIGFAWGGSDMLGWLKFCDPSPTSGILYCGAGFSAGFSCDPDALPGDSDFCGVTVSTDPPQISNPQPSVLPINTTTATLSVDTNMSATCRFSTTQGQSFDAMNPANTFTGTLGDTHHTFNTAGVIPDFVNGQSYVYYVQCKNEFGDESSEETIDFSVDEPAPPPNFSFSHNPFWPEEGVHDDHFGPDITMGNADLSSLTRLKFTGTEGLQNAQVTVTVTGLYEDRVPYISETQYGDGSITNETSLPLSTKITPVLDGVNRFSRIVVITNGSGEADLKVRRRNIQPGRYIITLQYSMPGVPNKEDTLVLIIGEGTPGYIEI